MRKSGRRRQKIQFGFAVFLIVAGVFLPRKESTGVPPASAPSHTSVAPPESRTEVRATPALIKKTSTPSKRERAAVQRIVDGDTIEILFRGAPDTVRLIGVDTPEKRDNEKARRDAARTGSDLKTIIAAGKGASAYLRSLIAPGAAIELEFDVRPRDKYGRLLAYVYRGDGVMLNEAMVLGGFASAYTVPPDVRYAERFRKAEAAARAGRQGLWR